MIFRQITHDDLARIEHILETHNHADHVSGHGRLVAATGARIHVHREAAPDYEHEPFDDGLELQLGSLTVRALHTPGHRSRLERDSGVCILDVRETQEWEAGHVPGSRCVPWHDLVELPEWIDRERPIAVICATGPRAGTAAVLLTRHGCRDVTHVADGGVRTWAALGHPLDT